MASLNDNSILHVGIDATCWSNDRGFGRFTRELLKALGRRSSSIRYTLIFDQMPDDDLPSGMAAVSAAAKDRLNGTSSRSADYVLRMGKLAGAAKFDVFFYPAVYSYFPLLATTPCVVCYHDTIAERFSDLIFPTKLNAALWWAKTRLARFQTRRAMTVSQASADDIHSLFRFPRSRIDVVTEAADGVFQPVTDAVRMAAARATCGVPEAVPMLVYVGGFNRHKNVQALLEAMPAVLSAHPDAHLVLVGSTTGAGFWDNINALRGFAAADPVLAPRVHFPGYLADPMLADLLSSAAALVFPSLAEGFGLPAVEAMSCGTPVLASDRGSLPEVVGEAGRFFDPEDRASIAACLIRFLSDPEGMTALRKVALERAAGFSWDRAAELAEQSFLRCAGRLALATP